MNQQDQKNNKMRQKLGAASELVDSDAFLPMFRNRQKLYAKQFEFSVKLAKRKKAPQRYFSVIWSRKNLAKTIDWLKKLIALERTENAEKRARAAAACPKDMKTNKAMVARINQLKAQHGLIS